RTSKPCAWERCQKGSENTGRQPPYLTSVFPYKDENPTELTPLITVGIIVLNVLAWLFVQGAGAAEPLARSVCQLGLIPGEVLHTVPPGTAVPLGEGLRLHTLITLGFFLTTVTLPAYVILGYWFLLQVLFGTVGVIAGAQGGGVAVWAHVGGFVAGLVLIKLFANPEYLERRRGGVIILPRDA